MATKKMNVLVYSGNGSTVESVRHCLYSLRRLLSPNYAVIPITESVILKEPWTTSCALLVFPGGADLGYCRSLNGDGNAQIAQFVRRGGAYLGLCAGGYYGGQRCEFEVGDKKLEVIGDRELSFFPGICRGCAYRGFKYQSEAGARAAALHVNKESFPSGAIPISFRCYYNGGGVFVDAVESSNKGVEVLASYVDPIDVDGGNGTAAVIYCKIGDGGAVLTGPHPEFASVNLDRRSGGPGYSKIVDALAEDDGSRTNFLKGCLSKLKLAVSDESSVPSLSRLHLSSANHIEASEVLEELQTVITSEDGELYIKGENDTFHIETHSSRWSMNSLVDSLPSKTDGKVNYTKPDQVDDVADEKILDYNKVIKRLIPHEEGWPGSKETPYFNHHAFYANLRRYQQENSSEAEEFGRVLMYGEVVTSTNTLLDKNMKLLSHLPMGFTATATIQVAGRGRGSNVWVSPSGSLIFSTVVHHPAALSNSAPVVFVQYLAALAIVEGIKSYDHGYANMPVKLKWPNDIYAQDPSKPDKKEYIKIGGILVNSSYTSGNYNLVVGVGLNTTNSLPTTSLNELLHLSTSSASSPSSPPQIPNKPPIPQFTLEKLLARILTSFETIYRQFLRKGFSRDLEQRYYQHWLHSDQIVTLESEGGARCRVLGISRDWGMLRVEELGWEDRRTGKVWEVQSDGNSFDFFKGLLKRKV